MTDIIEIQGLLLRPIVGINPDERINRQDVILDLRLSVDLRPAAASDDIADAVNYRTVCKEIIDFVEASTCLLVERLAEEVANICLKDPRVVSVTVKLQKPGALRFAQSVGVEITRTQKS